MSDFDFLPPEQIAELTARLDAVEEDFTESWFFDDDEETVEVIIMSSRTNVEDFIARYRDAAAGDRDAISYMAEFLRFVVEMMRRSVEP